MSHATTKKALDLQEIPKFLERRKEGTFYSSFISEKKKGGDRLKCKEIVNLRRTPCGGGEMTKKRGGVVLADPSYRNRREKGRNYSVERKERCRQPTTCLERGVNHTFKGEEGAAFFFIGKEGEGECSEVNRMHFLHKKFFPQKKEPSRPPMEAEKERTI